jgi:hypothetical protein
MDMKTLTVLSGKELRETAMEILALVGEVFPPKIAAYYEKEWLMENLSNPDSINIVVTDEKGAIRSYLLAMPLSKARKKLLEKGVEVEEDANDEKYYVDTLISNAPGRIFIKMVNQTMKIAWSRGQKAISMHARFLTGFANIIMTLFPVELVTVHENFMGYGEPFWYLEGDLKNVKWLQK